jgi:hypothetical protein
MRARVSAIARLFTIATLLVATTTCGEHHASALVAPPSPALLRCPSTQTLTTSALVTALGGTVNLGGTAVRIPAGALVAATTITLTVPASQFMEIDVKANDLVSFLFQQAISITIDYSRCSAAEANKAPLSVWRIDTQTKQLLENMGGVDAKTSHSITFGTGHLSGYAVAF